MNSNVIEFDRGKKLRKIKGLKRSIETYKQILTIKRDYLNKLQVFNKYSSISKQCHDTEIEIHQLEFEVGMFYSTIKKLEKEINE